MQLESTYQELERRLGKNFVRTVQAGVFILVFIGLGVYIVGYFDLLSLVNAAPIGMLLIGLGLGTGFGYDRVLKRINKLHLVPLDNKTSGHM